MGEGVLGEGELEGPKKKGTEKENYKAPGVHDLEKKNKQEIGCSTPFF